MADRDILRALASKVAEIAHLPVMADTARLYRALNGLNPIRPVVLLDELPWNQLNHAHELDLYCEDSYLRAVELAFRRTLYQWAHCPGDMLVKPFFALHRSVHIGSIGVTVEEDTLAADQGNHIVAHRYHDQLPDWEALEKLHVPEIMVDQALDDARRERLEGIFGDILPIRMTGVTHAGFFMPWDDLSMWRGAEPLMVDLVDRPEFIHALMRRITDIRIATLDKLEAMGLLDAYMPVLHCTAGLVDELPGDVSGTVTRQNLWGRGTAQIFSAVSPAMHDAFEIEYAREFFKGFGLVYYGCCEPLDRKIDVVKKLPNLRKISITPWADVHAAAEQMGGDYVLARKPNPAAVAVPVLDEEALRLDILDTLDACRRSGTPCEFTLKDISSVCYRPDNLTRWERVVKETVMNY
ncbi:MAG: hypothetical protein GX916_01330 [Clostridiales bacterium]|nr:hypothetical protein [Clostridiales bacterium]